MSSTAVPFLSAEWRSLVVANYLVDEETLTPFLPNGLSLDRFNGQTFVSVVAFGFQKTRIFGFLPVPATISFEEINLRFYVRREHASGLRRGVVFVKEVVPSRLVAAAARGLFNEPYVALPTTYSRAPTEDGTTHRYSFKSSAGEHVVSATMSSAWQSPGSGSLEEFILEHYWGYNQHPSGDTMEYRVEHPPWRCSATTSFDVSPSLATFYPKAFQEVLSRRPHSVFVAEGSPVRVFSGRRLRNRSSGAQKPLGWVLYDGACGFCAWWVPRWRKVIERTGYAIAPLQAPWVRTRLQVAPEQLTSDLRLLLRDGRVIDGADAYLFGMRRVWWARPIGLLLSLPGLRWLMWVFYRWFNKNRFLVSSICRLPPQTAEVEQAGGHSDGNGNGDNTTPK